MTEHLYWISSLVFAFVLLLLFLSEYLNNSSPTRVEKKYMKMICWVFFFCLQDFLWGICETGIINNEAVFFIASSLFHLSTVITTFFWLDYILEYLSGEIKHAKFYLTIDIIVIAGELFFVVLNFFKPVLFTIENGIYITQSLRPVSFFNQYVIYLSISVAAFLCYLRQRTDSKSKTKKKFISVFLFTLAPVLLGVFQLLYPDGPFYSTGYFLGCCVVHIFVIGAERERNERNRLLGSLADIYYTMHILDFELDTADSILESKSIGNIIEKESGIQNMLNAAMINSVTEEFLPEVMDFVDVKKLPERLNHKNHISMEFIGKRHGWTRISFIVVDSDSLKLKKVMLTTQIIQEEKLKQIDLLFQSNHDELTGLFNRHAYEAEIQRKKDSGMENNFVYVSMDLNGLKNVNDTLGHSAGDELLKGAADCMKQYLSLYGNVFRTGGDEFCALINSEPENIKQIISDFEDAVAVWKGNVVDNLSVSTGYVCRFEEDNLSIDEIISLADKRMYQAKADFYSKKGIDRRGQKDSYSALFALYTKILKINVTDDSYQILKMEESEQTEEKGFHRTISEWIESFGASGQVHKDDLQQYLEKTQIGYIRNYFAEGNKLLSIYYRRKINKDFKKVVMDIIPAADYSDENQSLFLYVKSIDSKIL